MSIPSLPASLEAATRDQPGARAALAAALSAGPSHAYLFAGPAEEAMAATARAFASELLADGAPDPDGARQRALADPSPHPDLAWLRPPGGQHLVEEVRERVIRAASLRPFEGDRRVFVVEAAENLADESQNALLKTLEEPPPYVHLLLLSSEPAGLKTTVASRCQRISFQPLTPEQIAERLRHGGALAEPEAEAVSRLASGELRRAQFLASERGQALRRAVERCARAARASELADRPWTALIELAEAEGVEAGRLVRERAEAQAELSGDRRGAARLRRQGADDEKRALRRRRTQVLDQALALSAAWFRDLSATAEGAPELALASDRHSELREDAAGLDPRRAREAAELALEARRRLRVNVSEELALEALMYRAEALLARG